MTTDIKDFVSYFGAPTNQSDCIDAILAVNDYCHTHPDVRIVGPAIPYVIGSTCFFGEAAAGSIIEWNMPGATFTISPGGAGIWFGGGTSGQITSSFQNTNSASARIQSALKGSTSLTLVALGDNSKFTVGRYIYISVGDLFGQGLPPDHAQFQYAKVTSIAGATIGLDRKLVFDYLSTWPLIDGGSVGGLDQGGPATIYAMPANWDVTLRCRGFLVDNGAGQIGAPLRRIELDLVTALHTNGIVPSGNEFFIDRGCDFSRCGIEADKAVYRWISDGSRYNRIAFQSAASAMLFLAKDIVVADRLLGLPARTILINPTLTAQTGGQSALRLAPNQSGSCDDVQVFGGWVPSIDYAASGDSDILNNGYSISGAVLWRAASAGAIYWGVIGRQLSFCQQNKANNWQSRIIDVRKSGSNFEVELADVVPAWVGNGHAVAVALCPAHSIHFEGVTGCPTVVDFSNAGARDRPIYEYSKRTYSGSAGTNIEALESAEPVNLMGHITRIDVRVTRAYTGSQSTLLTNLFNPLRQVNPDGSLSLWDPVIDLKHAGTRTFLPGVGWTGVLGSDSLADPGDIWFAGNQQITVNHDVSGEAPGLQPIFEVEVNLNQDVVQPASPAHSSVMVFG